MKAKFQFKHASKLTDQELRDVEKLRIPDVGLIWEDYHDHKHEPKCFVILCANSKSVFAWGMIYYCEGEAEWRFSVFVKRQYRRRGFGARIYRLMKREIEFRHDAVKVYRHDDASFAFFDRVQCKKD